MHRSASHRSPSRSDRKTIAFITLFFILVSAVFHFMLGNLGMHDFWMRSGAATPARDFMHISTLQKLPSSTPTPKPTPTPRALPSQAPAKPQPLKLATAAPAKKPNVALPHRQSDTPYPVTSVTDATAPPGPVVTFAPQLSPTDANGGPEASPTPIEASDMIIAAEFEHRIIPQYPSMAIDAHWEGTVIVLVTIGANGIIDARIGTSSGYATLDRAALVAAKESTYRPPELNGRPAIETYRVIYTFTLNDA